MRRQLDKNTQTEILGDGITVWVNRGGSLIGRFGLAGIDIHREITDQASIGECLQCTHGMTTAEDWETFKTGMKTHYSVDVSDKFKPDRFKNPA